MRNLNPATYEELNEAVVRHMANQRREGDGAKRNEQRDRVRPPLRDTPSRTRDPELRQLDPGREKDGNPSLSWDVRQAAYFRCGKKGHFKRDCRVKLEGANLGISHAQDLPKWTRPVEVNGKPVLALIDTGCTKSVVHPRCIRKSDYLLWEVPYTTASSRKTQFPAAKITLTIGGKDYDLAVGVSKHLTMDMLMGQDIPHFRKYLREALEVKNPVQQPPPPPPPAIATESSMVVTRMQQQAQDQHEREEQFEQERDKPVAHPLDPVCDGGDAEETKDGSMNQDEESAEEAVSEQDSETEIG